MPWTKLLADAQHEQEISYTDTAGDRIITYEQAVTEAIDQSMQLDSNVIVLGEGVDTAGYIYNTTSSLSEKYGKARVIETPIAESAITGITLGSAIAGLRPVLMHMRNDFLLISMDQIVNHIAHWKKIFGGKVPLVIRAIIARGWGSGAQHSQSFHTLFAGFDGLKVVMPSTPFDVKGMFMAAVASDEPVIFFEHRWLYRDRGVVPREPYAVSLDKSVLRREGRDITVVAMSLSNRDAGKTLDDLQKDNITADWIDLRSINPIDTDRIISSVVKTERLLIIENGPVNCGIGAEIAARLSERPWNEKKIKISRLGWAGSTVPAGPKLEEKFYLSPDEIKDAIRKMVRE